MKKILLSVALLAATFGASAQKLSYIPYEDNALMMGITISANGRYVAGSDTEGRAFIYDTQAKQIKYFQSPNLGETDADLDDPGFYLLCHQRRCRLWRYLRKVS